MADRPEELQNAQRQGADSGVASRGDPEEGARGYDAARDVDDPREEEGWCQPESSAQKGAEPDHDAG
jgi:hypothetical protein